MVDPFGNSRLEFVDTVEGAAPDALSVISANSRLTRLSQEEDVGVKCSLKRLCLASQRFTAGVLWVA